MNDGTVLDLPKLIEIRNEYCLRLIIDETISFGSLGNSGRGVCEHFNVSRDLVEVSIGSLGSCFGSLGGFTLGTKELCAYQRLGSYAYIFSASPPCFSVIAASKAIEILRTDAESRIQSLRQNSALIRKELKSIPKFKVLGDEVSPLIHLQYTESISLKEADTYLQSIVDECILHDLAISKSKFCRSFDVKPSFPTLKIYVSSGHTSEQIQKGVSILKGVIESVKIPSIL